MRRLVLITLVALSVLTSSFAQSSSPPRKKIDDFGSSLKRQKWNAEKNSVEVVAKDPGTELDEGDVIYVYTSLVTCDLLVLDERGNSVPGQIPSTRGYSQISTSAMLLGITRGTRRVTGCGGRLIFR